MALTINYNTQNVEINGKLGLTIPLANIFTHSLSIGEFLSEWKRARVVAVPKGDIYAKFFFYTIDNNSAFLTDRCFSLP